MKRRRYERTNKEKGTTHNIERDKSNNIFASVTHRTHKVEPNRLGGIINQQGQTSNFPQYSPLDSSNSNPQLSTLFLRNGKVNNSFKFNQDNIRMITNEILIPYKNKIDNSFDYDFSNKSDELFKLKIEESSNSLLDPTDVVSLIAAIKTNKVKNTDVERLNNISLSAKFHSDYNVYVDLKREFISKKKNNVKGIDLDKSINNINGSLNDAIELTQKLAENLTPVNAIDRTFSNRLQFNRVKGKLSKKLQKAILQYEDLISKSDPSLKTKLKSDNISVELLSKRLSDAREILDKAMKNSNTTSNYRNNDLRDIQRKFKNLAKILGDEPDSTLIDFTQDQELQESVNKFNKIKSIHGKAMNNLYSSSDSSIDGQSDIEHYIKEGNLAIEDRELRPHVKVVYDPISDSYTTLLTRPFRNEQIIITPTFENDVRRDSNLEPFVKKALITNNKLLKLNLNSLLSHLIDPSIDRFSNIPLARNLTEDEQRLIQDLIITLKQDGFDGSLILDDYIKGLNEIEFNVDKHASALKILRDFRSTYDIEKEKIIQDERTKIANRYRFNDSELFDDYPFQLLTATDEHVRQELVTKFDYRNEVTFNNNTQDILKYGVDLGLFEIIDFEEIHGEKFPSTVIIKNGDPKTFTFDYGDPNAKDILIKEIEESTGQIPSQVEKKTVEMYKKRAIRLKLSYWTIADLYKYANVFQFPIDRSNSSMNKRQQFLDSLNDEFFKQVLVDNPKYISDFGLDEISLQGEDRLSTGTLTDEQTTELVSKFRDKMKANLVDRISIENDTDKIMRELNQAVENRDEKKARELVFQLSKKEKNKVKSVENISNDPSVGRNAVSSDRDSSPRRYISLVMDIFAEILANPTLDKDYNTQIGFDLGKQLKTQEVFESDEFQDLTRKPHINQRIIDSTTLSKSNEIPIELANVLDIETKNITIDNAKINEQAAKNVRKGGTAGQVEIDQKEISNLLKQLPKKEVADVKEAVKERIIEGGPTGTEIKEVEIQRIKSNPKLTEKQKSIKISEKREIQQDMDKEEELTVTLKDISDEILEGSVTLLDQLNERDHTVTEQNFAKELNVAAIQLDKSLDIMSALIEVDNSNKTEADELLFTQEYVRSNKLLNDQINRITDIIPQDRLEASDFTKAGINQKDFLDTAELRKRGAKASDINRFEKNYPNIELKTMFDVLTQLVITKNDVNALAKEVIPKSNFRTRRKFEPIEFKNKRSKKRIK